MENDNLYTINKIAETVGISTRSLRYYDDIGLLVPTGRNKSGHRVYDQEQLLKLQQIMFLKELDFSLEEISMILSKNVNLTNMLVQHKFFIKKEIKRLQKLLKNIDRTILDIKKRKMTKIKDLYDGFSKKQIEEYKTEARKRWGKTDAYKQSQVNYNKMSQQEIKKIESIQKSLAVDFSKLKDTNRPVDKVVQKKVKEHFDVIGKFYTPTKKMYLGLGTMYLQDNRFKDFYDRNGAGTAEFLKTAIEIFCKDDSNFK